jgi:hypothetical protein
LQCQSRQSLASTRHQEECFRAWGHGGSHFRPILHVGTQHHAQYRVVVLVFLSSSGKHEY